MITFPRLLCGVCLCALFGSSLDIIEAADPPHVVVFKKGSDGYNVFRIPAIVRAANGDLLAFCEAREGGDASEIDLVLKRSTDHGATWGELQVIERSEDYRTLFPGDPPPITLGNPSPVVDRLDPEHPGRIWLPFTLENDRVFVTFSDDNGATWAQQRDITSDVKRDEWGWYATGPVHSIQLQRGSHKGRLVIPADHRVGEDGTDDGPNGVQVVYSDDHGRTWQLGAIDDTYEDGLNANETTLVELNDGRLYVNTRDQGGDAPGTRGEAWSDNGGESFATSGVDGYRWFRPAPDVLDAPVVQCSLLRAASKLDGDELDVLLFAGPDDNGPTGKGRSDLRIRVSTDEARTWQDGLLIHTGPAAYSDMVRLDGGRIGVLFEAGQPKQGTYDSIRFVDVALSEIIQTSDAGK